MKLRASSSYHKLLELGIYKLTGFLDPGVDITSQNIQNPSPRASKCRKPEKI